MIMSPHVSLAAKRAALGHWDKLSTSCSSSCRRKAVVSGLGNSGPFTCTVPSSMQMYWITESMLFSSCLSFHKVGDVLDPTSLVLIASPVLCSLTIKRSTVVVVGVLKVK